eukprot:g27194.t1
MSLRGSMVQVTWPSEKFARKDAGMVNVQGVPSAVPEEEVREFLEQVGKIQDLRTAGAANRKTKRTSEESFSSDVCGSKRVWATQPKGWKVLDVGGDKECVLLWFMDVGVAVLC